MSGGPETPTNPDVDALKAWRQGDCSLEPASFVFAVERGEEQGGGFEAVDVYGLVVITQSCDIVLSGEQRAFVQVAPLVEVDEACFRDASRGRRIHYAYVPGVADRRVVADLARVMTVSKEIVASWTRVEGCRSDEERRAFALCISRKFSRAALPDDFAVLIENLRTRIVDKHARASSEGETLRGLRDIRVVAAPDWRAEKIDLTFWFICEDKVPADAYTLLEKWLALIPPSGRYVSVDGQVLTLDDLTARDYVESDPLDFEHLSATTPGA